MTIWLKLIPKILQYDNNLKSNFIVALFLSFILSFFAVGVFVYSYSLFLSTYPIAWIPYWILAESVLIFVVGTILSFFVPDDFKKYSQYILSAASIMVVLFLWISQFAWYWTPFIIVVVLRIFVTIVGTAVWSLLPTLFYFQQFKKIINRFTMISSLSAIFSPILYSVTMVYFDLSWILVGIVASLVIGIFIIQLVTPVLSNADLKITQHRKNVISPLRYQVFRTLFLISLILSIIYECGEFLFRGQLTQHFNQEQIAFFISGFISIASLLSLVTQLLVPTILSRVRFYQIFQIIFLCMGLTAMAYWISPTLWPATLLAGIRIIFEHGWIKINRKNITNIFPPALMGRCELYIYTYVTPIGGVLAALMAIFSTHLSLILDHFPLIIIMLSIIGAISSFWLFKQYVSTLKEMIIPAGFLKFYDNIKEQKRLQKLVIERLEDPNVTEMELSIIVPKLFKTPPQILYRLLTSHPNDNIKSTIIKILSAYPIHLLDIQKLINVIENDSKLSEANQESLLKLLSDIHSPMLLNKAKSKLLTRPHSKNALLVLLKNGNTSDYIFALGVTLQLAKDKECSKRIIAAKLLSTLGGGRFYDLKKKLITDKDSSVRTAAFNHLSAQDVEYMLPNLGKFFNYNQMSLLHQKFTVKELIHLAQRLMQLYHYKSDEYVFCAITFITPIPSQQLEPYICEFLKIKNNHQRTLLAIEILARKKHVTFSNMLSQELRKALEYELETINQYRQILRDPSLKFAEKLIENRIYYATLRFLDWYAAFHPDTTNISSSISKLNPYHLTSQTKQIQGKAVEFLITTEKDFQIRSMIENVFVNTSLSKFNIDSHWQSILLNDPWLYEILSKYTSKGDKRMNPLQRVIALQKTTFFESLADEVLYALGQCCELLDFAEQEVIIQQGDEGDSLYILVEGEIAIYKNQKLLTNIQPVTCIGEMALLGAQKRTTTATAKKRSLLLVLPKEEFIKITNEFPQILHNIIKIISRRFMEQISIYEGESGMLDSLSELD